MPRDWLATAEGLVRLARDQKGKPEAWEAAHRLQAITRRHPEVLNSPLIQRFVFVHDLDSLVKAASSSSISVAELKARLEDLARAMDKAFALVEQA
jgi:hypothetical protein